MSTPKHKETISLYKEGLAMMGKKAGQVDKEYYIVSDTLAEGTRTIVLKEKDKVEIRQKVKQLVDAILNQLGETRSKALKGILTDTLLEFWDSEIERLYNRIVVKQEPVHARPGCFEIIVGKDGRKKSSEKIMLRS